MAGRPPTPERKASKRKGKTSIRWHEDLDILNRLDVVASMMIQGAKAHHIAESLGYAVRTAYRDMARVRELWRKNAIDDVIANRDQSISQFREVQSRAWEQYRKTQKISWLKLAMDAEKEIVALQGTKAPAGIDLTSGGEALAFSAKELSDDDLAKIAMGTNGHHG